MYSYSPGDRLLVMKAAVIDNAITHSGTYMGQGLVAHISPSKGLMVEPLEIFADGQQPKVLRNGGIHPSLLKERLKTFSKNANYLLVSNNCEHLCSYLETGKAKSPQLQGSLIGCAIGFTVARHLNVQNPWLALLITGLTTFVGAKIGAPRAKQTDLTQPWLASL